MKVKKSLLAAAQPYDPFCDLPAGAEKRCKTAANVAIAVYRYRKERNWSQAELGRHLGMQQSQISKLENGDCNLTIEKLEDVLKKLDCEVTINSSVRNLYASNNAYSQPSVWHAFSAELKRSVLSGVSFA